MALPFSFGAIRGLLRELEVSERGERPLAVGGERELAEVLRRELGRGAAPGAIRANDAPEGAAVLLYVLGHDPVEADEHALKRARRAKVPIVAVLAGPVGEDISIPYVLATDVVRVSPGAGFPLEEIAVAVANRLSEDGAPLAARVPFLRRAVCDALIRSFSRRNAAIAAAVFIPGADLPLLTLNQLRLVLRLAQAHGEEIGRDRLPEVAATVGAGFGFRAVARSVLGVVPVAGWAVQGAVAYSGTRAVGEAALARFELGSAAGSTPPPA